MKNNFVQSSTNSLDISTWSCNEKWRIKSKKKDTILDNEKENEKKKLSLMKKMTPNMIYDEKRRNYRKRNEETTWRMREVIIWRICAYIWSEIQNQQKQIWNLLKHGSDFVNFYFFLYKI